VQAIGDLVNKVVRAGTFGTTFGGIEKQNKYGTIAIDPITHSGDVGSLTQGFRNGELWAVNVDLLRRGSNRSPPLIGSKQMEMIFHNSLHAFANMLAELGRVDPPFTVEAGIVDIKDWVLLVADKAGAQYLGQMHESSVIVRKILRDLTAETIDKFLLEIFESIFDQTGYPRPQGLYGFPGDIPCPRR